MQELLGLRFLYVTGKGGVGKSTVAAGLATALAESGRKVLLVYEHGSLGQERLLGRTLGLAPEPVLPGFFACGIEAESAMQEYARSVLKSARLTDALFHGQIARGFLHGIPGLSAWAFLGKAWYFAEPTSDGPALGAPRFDCVVVDGPATGDSTDMLRVPSIIRQLAPKGRLRRDADLCDEMLRDPKRTAIVLVTTLEELPVTETEGLCAALRQDLGLPLGPLLVNQVTPRIFAAAARAELLQRKAPTAAARAEDEVAVATLALGSRRARAEQLEDEFRARLARLGLFTREIPALEPEPRGPRGLHELSVALALPPPGSYRAKDP